MIGCGLDLNLGEIHLTRNGTALPGKFAFDMVKRGVSTLPPLLNTFLDFRESSFSNIFKKLRFS